MRTHSPPYTIPNTFSSRTKWLIASFPLDRARVGKHIVGHPLTYVPSASSSRDRAETMPTRPPSQPYSMPLEPIQKFHTFPAGDGSPPAGPDAVPRPDTSSQAPGDTDLENGSQTSMTNHHWWQRKRSARKPHSPVTMAAHKKSPYKLFKDIMFSSWANLLLVFIPVGIALHFVPNVNPTVIFVMNFLAIIPLAGLLSFATEEISLKVGQTLGGLMNATFGNAVELIVGIIALIQGKITIVQASLLGSMLSNLLLVMGMCFFFGGLKHKEQSFNVTTAQTASSLLALAIFSLLVPAAFHASLGDTAISNNGVLQISRGTAFILLVIYAMYLYFQLKSHAYLYDEIAAEETEAAMEMATITPWWAGGLLIVSTVFVALCAEFLVDSIDGMVAGSGISETFVGLILLPIVGNAAEHVTAVTVAIKDKMDLAIGVAVGSSIQIALLVTPLMVIIGWPLGANMTLFFNIFETSILFVSVLIVNYLIQDGKSNYLEGGLLMAVYIIIAVAVWFYPTL